MDIVENGRVMFNCYDEVTGNFFIHYQSFFIIIIIKYKCRAIEIPH